MKKVLLTILLILPVAVMANGGVEIKGKVIMVNPDEGYLLIQTEKRKREFKDVPKEMLEGIEVGDEVTVYYNEAEKKVVQIVKHTPM